MTRPSAKCKSLLSLLFEREMLKALLIDLSGTLHVAHEATPGAGAALQALRDAGVFVRFCSNTSKESSTYGLSHHKQYGGANTSVQNDRSSLK